MRLKPTSGKICAVPGCGIPLIVGNTSGVCRNHGHKKEYCGCARCVARRAVPVKVFTYHQERAAAELRRLNHLPEPTLAKAKPGEKPPVPVDWRGEHLIRGTKF